MLIDFVCENEIWYVDGLWTYKLCRKFVCDLEGTGYFDGMKCFKLCKTDKFNTVT